MEQHRDTRFPVQRGGSQGSFQSGGSGGHTRGQPPIVVGVPIATATAYSIAAAVDSLNPPTAMPSEVPPQAPVAVPISSQGAEENLSTTARAAASPEVSELDLVFTMDCTGSMGSYINNAKRNIELIVRRLADAEGYDLRVGLVAYRDHPPQDNSFITKTFPFTADVGAMRRNLSTLSAAGGGDGPEAVGAALYATRTVPWRKHATKVCVLIADAPPHGLGESGDGFPDGEPDGSDPIAELDQLSELGVALYAVGCQPALAQYKFATDFFVACAERTNGQAVSLSSAAALADVIMGGAIEEMDLSKLSNVLEQDVQQMRCQQPALNDDELVESVHRQWMHKGIRSRQVKHRSLSAKYGTALREADSIRSAKASFEAAAAAAPHLLRLPHAALDADGELHRTLDERSLKRAAAGSRFAEFMRSSSLRGEVGSDASVEIAVEAVSCEQVKRLFGKCKKTGKL
mmetsp:Transcript_38959/g.81800  ORF Transcript_38959/g.81800 Transcript_38959/m.81800 type:complete len:460 (-) Transcript_38959:390-1769(-)